MLPLWVSDCVRISSFFLRAVVGGISIAAAAIALSSLSGEGRGAVRCESVFHTEPPSPAFGLDVK